MIIIYLLIYVSFKYDIFGIFLCCHSAVHLEFHQKVYVEWCFLWPKRVKQKHFQLNWHDDIIHPAVARCLHKMPPILKNPYLCHQKCYQDVNLMDRYKKSVVLILSNQLKPLECPFELPSKYWKSPFSNAKEMFMLTSQLYFISSISPIRMISWWGRQYQLSDREM